MSKRNLHHSLETIVPSLHSNGLNWVGKKVRAVFVNVSRFVNIGYSMNCLDVYCNQLDRLYIDIEEKQCRIDEFIMRDHIYLHSFRRDKVARALD